jgi:hypothetical protein
MFGNVKCEMLEVLFAAVQNLRFMKVFDWLAIHITMKHSDVGRFSDMERVIKDFSEQRIWW